MKAYKGDMIYCKGIYVTIADILYQDFYEGNFDIEFTDTEGIYRHWKQEYDGGRFIPAIDKHFAMVKREGSIIKTIPVEYKGVEYMLYRLPGGGKAFKWLVTCREPYISRFERYEDSARNHAEYVINNNGKAIETTYNRSFNDRFVYDMEV